MTDRKSPAQLGQKIEKPKSLTALACDRIRSGITSGRYPLGSPLFEKVLAEDYGISKTPVREALVQLQHEGLVVVVPHSGTFVFDLGEGDVAELCELRLILETNALRLAIQRQPNQLQAELARIVEEMREALAADDVVAYRERDTAFHDVLFALSGNGYLASSYASIEAKIATLRVRLMTPLPEIIAQGMREHEAIATAVATGNFQDAIRALTTHIRRGRDVMQRLNEVDPVDVTEIEANQAAMR